MHSLHTPQGLHPTSASSPCSDSPARLRTRLSCCCPPSASIVCCIVGCSGPALPCGGNSAACAWCTAPHPQRNCSCYEECSVGCRCRPHSFLTSSSLHMPAAHAFAPHPHTYTHTLSIHNQTKTNQIHTQTLTNTLSQPL